ncbi:MAG: dihydrofolate reductase [Holosporaceae bacterium]|jgi:dihydrofolate reductase|nr:dihydrofolate reductase [Holosporaceae bacterium]
MIKLIAAVDSNWGISKNGIIPWHMPEDLRFFREKTVGGVVVMGRITFFSIEKRPLNDRINCLVSTTLTSIDGARVFKSFENIVDEYKDFWIIGGAQLYNYALRNKFVDYALITCIHKDYNTDKFLCKRYLDKFSTRSLHYDKKYSLIEFFK